MRTELTVSVVPGDGVVIRSGDVVVACPGIGAPDAAAIRRIVEAVRAAAVAEDPADELHDRLEGAAEGGPLPALGAIVAGDPITAIVIGDADVHVTGPGSETHLSGRNTPEPVVRTIAEPLQSIVVGATADPTERPWLDLVEGVVPGSGVAVRMTTTASGAVSAPPSTGRTAEPDAAPEPPESAPPAPFEAISFTGAFEAPAEVAPLPVETAPAAEDLHEPEPEPGGALVEGLRCRRGHFNHPNAANCAWCGLAMVQDSYVLVRDVRPPLGVLVVNEQATFTLDSDYVIGRSPQRDPRVQSDEVRPLALQDPDRSVSRVHAGIELQDWDVVVVDRGSANGTWVIDPGAANWERLPADSLRVLQPGGHVQIGPHRLTFHSHHVR